MTEIILTDEQTTKALECCKDTIAEGKCPQCPLYTVDDVTCVTVLCKNIFNLISRKNAEIDVLKTNIHSLTITLSNRARVERAEAIREFAERLKEVGTKIYGGKGFEGAFVIANNLQIDNLVKEMTESKTDTSVSLVDGHTEDKVFWEDVN